MTRGILHNKDIPLLSYLSMVVCPLVRELRLLIKYAIKCPITRERIGLKLKAGLSKIFLSTTGISSDRLPPPTLPRMAILANEFLRQEYQLYVPGQLLHFQRASLGNSPTIRRSLPSALKFIDPQIAARIHLIFAVVGGGE